MKDIIVCTECLMAFKHPKDSNDHLDKTNHWGTSLICRSAKDSYNRINKLFGEKKIIQLTPEQYGLPRIQVPDQED